MSDNSYGPAGSTGYGVSGNMPAGSINGVYVSHDNYPASGGQQAYVDGSNTLYSAPPGSVSRPQMQVNGPASGSDVSPKYIPSQQMPLQQASPGAVQQTVAAPGTNLQPPTSNPQLPQQIPQQIPQQVSQQPPQVISPSIESISPASPAVQLPQGPGSVVSPVSVPPVSAIIKPSAVSDGQETTTLSKSTTVAIAIPLSLIFVALLLLGGIFLFKKRRSSNGHGAAHVDSEKCLRASSQPSKSSGDMVVKPEIGKSNIGGVTVIPTYQNPTLSIACPAHLPEVTYQPPPPPPPPKPIQPMPALQTEYLAPKVYHISQQAISSYCPSESSIGSEAIIQHASSGSRQPAILVHSHSQYPSSVSQANFCDIQAPPIAQSLSSSSRRHLIPKRTQLPSIQSHVCSIISEEPESIHTYRHQSYHPHSRPSSSSSSGSSSSASSERYTRRKEYARSNYSAPLCRRSALSIRSNNSDRYARSLPTSLTNGSKVRKSKVREVHSIPTDLVIPSCRRLRTEASMEMEDDEFPLNHPFSSLQSCHGTSSGRDERPRPKRQETEFSTSSSSDSHGTALTGLTGTSGATSSSGMTLPWGFGENSSSTSSRECFSRKSDDRSSSRVTSKTDDHWRSRGSKKESVELVREETLKGEVWERTIGRSKGRNGYSY